MRVAVSAAVYIPSGTTIGSVASTFALAATAPSLRDAVRTIQDSRIHPVRPNRGHKRHTHMHRRCEHKDNKSRLCGWGEGRREGLGGEGCG